MAPDNKTLLQQEVGSFVLKRWPGDTGVDQAKGSLVEATYFSSECLPGVSSYGSDDRVVQYIRLDCSDKSSRDCLV